MRHVFSYRRHRNLARVILRSGLEISQMYMQYLVSSPYLRYKTTNTATHSARSAWRKGPGLVGGYLEDIVLSCATRRAYSDRDPRVVGPRSAPAAAEMLSCRSKRPRLLPLPCLRPATSASCLWQVPGMERRARRERRCLMIFNPLLTCMRLRNTGRARGHESAHDLCRALREAAVGTCTAIRWAGGR